MLAARHGNTDAVRLLIDKGADVKAKDNVRQRFFIGTVWDCVFVCMYVCVFYSSIILYDK